MTGTPALRVVRGAAGDDEAPRDDDEQEPREPGGPAGDDADAEPDDEQQRAGPRPGEPAARRPRQDRAVTASSVKPGTPAAPGTWRGADAGGGKLVQVDGGKVGEQGVEIAVRFGGEHLLQAVL